MDLIKIQQISSDCFGKNITILLKEGKEVHGLLMSRKIEPKLIDSIEVNELVSITLLTKVEEMKIKVDSIDSIVPC